MAAGKSTDRGPVYTVTDAHGNPMKLAQGALSPVTRVPTISITSGGVTMFLTQQNVTDLLATLTAFSTTGMVL